MIAHYELKPSPACGRGWRGEAAPGEGMRSSKAKFSLNERRQMILAHRNIRPDAENSPTKRFNFFLAFGVTLVNRRKSMHAAIDFHNQIRFNNREIDDESPNSMLPPDDDAKFAQAPQRFPCDCFGSVGVLTQPPRGANFLAFSHERMLQYSAARFNERAPHPRPLSRERERGEDVRHD